MKEGALQIKKNLNHYFNGSKVTVVEETTEIFDAELEDGTVEPMSIRYGIYDVQNTDSIYVKASCTTDSVYIFPYYVACVVEQ